MWTIETLKVLMDERFAARDQNLELQAKEYERRLSDLNHAHDQAVAVQHTYVTQEKYEDKLAAEETARELALKHIEDKFEEHVKRYELRQREVDQALAISEAAAEQAKQISEEQGRKANRNIAIVGIALAFIVGLANWAGSF